MEPLSALLWEDSEKEENKVGTSASPCSEHHTFSRLGGTAWDKIRTTQCLAGWAEVQAVLRLSLFTPGNSQSTALSLVVYLLPTHVAFSADKQLFYGLPPTEAR